MRSHPPSILRQVERTLREECQLAPGDSILLGVSGGTDSMALLHALAQLAPKLDFRIEACGINHGLRTAAAGELSQAAEYAARLGIEYHRRAVDLAPGGNLQARARELRYATLRDVQNQRGLALLATAHHADDRAETVLIRLLRGAPIAGLAVLPPRDEALIRPLIRVRKNQICQYLQRLKIPVAEDPSNRDERFLRTRVRSELVPLMTELSPGIVDSLNHLVDELQQERIPPILDENGDEIRLGRGQREQLRRAIRYQQRGTRVLLSGGRAVVLDRRTGQPRVISVSKLQEKADANAISPPKPLNDGC